LTVVQFLFFVRGQLANFTRIVFSVNRISENYLALMMPTEFPVHIPANPQKRFPSGSNCVKISRTAREFHASNHPRCCENFIYITARFAIAT
jgi:hypothetical protein